MARLIADNIFNAAHTVIPTVIPEFLPVFFTRFVGKNVRDPSNTSASVGVDPGHLALRAKFRDDSTGTTL